MHILSRRHGRGDCRHVDGMGAEQCRNHAGEARHEDAGLHWRLIAVRFQHGKSRQVLRSHGHEVKRQTNADDGAPLEDWHDELWLRECWHDRC